MPELIKSVLKYTSRLVKSKSNQIKIYIAPYVHEDSDFRGAIIMLSTSRHNTIPCVNNPVTERVFSQIVFKSIYV